MHKEEILLSILIPSIPSRFEMMRKLVAKLEQQIAGLPVEILIFSDNKRRSIGMKRDALVQISNGLFCAFVDDDDDIVPTYAKELVQAIMAHRDADVIAFKQRVFLEDDDPFIVWFGLEYENEQAVRDENGKYVDITRKPFQACAWKTELAKSSRFPDLNYSEDSLWLEPLWKKAKFQYKINEILHEYHYRSAVSEAKNE